MQQNIKLNLIGQCGFEQDKIFTWSYALSQISGLCEITTYLTYQVKIGSVKAGYHAWTKIFQMFNIIIFKIFWCLFPHFSMLLLFQIYPCKILLFQGLSCSWNDVLHLFTYFFTYDCCNFPHFSMWEFFWITSSKCLHYFEIC